MLNDFRAFGLAKKYYQQCKRQKLPHFLKDQLNRASSSIALNLAEGSGKRTKADQIRFYSIAFGSLRESQAILEIENIDNPELQNLSDQLGAILYKLCRMNSGQTENCTPNSN